MAHFTVFATDDSNKHQASIRLADVTQPRLLYFKVYAVIINNYCKLLAQDS